MDTNQENTVEIFLQKIRKIRFCLISLFFLFFVFVFFLFKLPKSSFYFVLLDWGFFIFGLFLILSFIGATFYTNILKKLSNFIKENKNINKNKVKEKKRELSLKIKITTFLLIFFVISSYSFIFTRTEVEDFFSFNSFFLIYFTFFFLYFSLTYLSQKRALKGLSLSSIGRYEILDMEKSETKKRILITKILISFFIICFLISLLLEYYTINKHFLFFIFIGIIDLSRYKRKLNFPIEKKEEVYVKSNHSPLFEKWFMKKRKYDLLEYLKTKGFSSRDINSLNYKNTAIKLNYYWTEEGTFGFSFKNERLSKLGFFLAILFKGELLKKTDFKEVEPKQIIKINNKDSSLKISLISKLQSKLKQFKIMIGIISFKNENVYVEFYDYLHPDNLEKEELKLFGGKIPLSKENNMNLELNKEKLKGIDEVLKILLN